jgi:hypothetical protein
MGRDVLNLVIWDSEAIRHKIMTEGMQSNYYYNAAVNA